MEYTYAMRNFKEKVLNKIGEISSRNTLPSNLLHWINFRSVISDEFSPGKSNELSDVPHEYMSHDVAQCCAAYSPYLYYPGEACGLSCPVGTVLNIEFASYGNPILTHTTKSEWKVTYIMLEYDTNYLS